MAFTGLVTSDFMKRVRLDDSKKESLLNFAATDFISLRENLVNYVKAAYPLDYNFFVSSDLGVMFLELTAAMGHILSYKADYLANENYLRTARSRESVKNLLDLIGVRMKGPTGAAANATITLNNPIWTNSNDYLTISPEQRVLTITSPEDGSQLSYTLYKTTPEGMIDTSDSSEQISILRSENTSETQINNLALIEGNLVKQTGQFYDTDVLKTISLNQSPIIEGSVQIFIEGTAQTQGNYTQIENIFSASGPGDKVFQLATDNNFTGRVFFGDNLIGQSPSIGDTYTVYYRIGGGTRGNVGRGVINGPVNVTFYNSSNTSLGTGTGNITNSSVATGGSTAQTIENAKRYAPLLFRSQDRLVTLNDYKGFTNSFRASLGSTGKATATVRRAFSSANIIDLYILEKANDTQMKRATPEFKKQLLEAIEPKKMLTDEVVIVDGLIRTIDPVVTVRCDLIYKQREPDIKLRVRDSIVEFFSVDNLDFGKSYNSLEVTRKIFNDVPEVRYSTIDNLPQSIKLQFNEIIQLNNLSIVMVFE